MRRLACFLFISALCACGPTQSATSGGSGCSDTGCGTAGTTGGDPVPCTRNADCAIGVCQSVASGDHFCQAQCSVDTDCGAGNICNERAQCLPRPGMAASSGGASTSATSSTTGATSSTTGATSSTTSATSSTTSATSSTTGATSSTTGGTSSTTGSTTAGSTTGGGRCTAGSCPNGKTCDFGSGQCVNQSGNGAVGASCTNASSCTSGYCQLFGDGQRRCTRTCSASAQCPASFVCAGQAGADPFTHPNGLGICVATSVYYANYTVGSAGVGQSCPGTTPTHNDCHSVFGCDPSGGTCTDTCGRDSDCGVSGWICVAYGSLRVTYCAQDPGGSGTVGTSCPDDGYCKTGICNRNGSQHFCSKECCTQSDCGALGSATCLAQLDASGSVYRACVDEPSGASVALGGSCDPHNSNTCHSGYCMSVDPTQPALTSGYCSTTCCTDADCSALANSHCVLEDDHLRWSDGGFTGYMGVCVKR